MCSCIAFTAGFIWRTQFAAARRSTALGLVFAALAWALSWRASFAGNRIVTSLSYKPKCYTHCRVFRALLFGDQGTRTDLAVKLLFPQVMPEKEECHHLNDHRHQNPQHDGADFPSAAHP